MSDSWIIDEKVMSEEFKPLVEALVNKAREHDVPLHITIEYGQIHSEDDQSITIKNNTTHITGSRAGPMFADLKRITVLREVAFDVMMEKVAESIHSTLHSNGMSKSEMLEVARNALNTIKNKKENDDDGLFD